MSQNNKSLYKEVEEYNYKVSCTFGKLTTETVATICEQNDKMLLKGIISDKSVKDEPKYYFVFENNPFSDALYDYLVITIPKQSKTPNVDFIKDFTMKVVDYSLCVIR